MNTGKGTQWGVGGNPRKFRHSALWNFLGVVRGMTTRQRLPHLSEALWRDAETPGNSATPVPQSAIVRPVGWRTPETPIFPQPFLRCRQGGLRERSRSGFSRMFSYGGLGACAAEAKSAEDRGRYGDGCQLPSLPTRPILSAAPFWESGYLKGILPTSSARLSIRWT